jgi:hypothetical protein
VSRDGEELLEFGRSPRPRWVRISAVVAVVVAVAVGVVLRTWPHQSDRVLVPQPTSTYVIGPPRHGTFQPAPWPTAPSACGDDTELAIVSSAQVSQPTGLRLMVGGSDLRTVEFDSGLSTPVGGLELRPGEFVNPATSSLAVTSSCNASGPNSGSRLVRIDAAGHATVGGLLTGSNSYLMIDGAQVWVVTQPADPTGSAALTALGGGPPVHLPPGFAPAAIIGGAIVGSLPPLAGAGTGDASLVLVDAATGRVREHLGTGSFLAASKDQLLWTVGCRIDSGQTCLLSQRRIAGGPVHDYQLQRPPGFAAAVVSPDGSMVAFVMERSGQDPRYDQGHPIPPGDVVIMHLDSLQVHVVPDVEVPAKSAPGLAFSADGNWLVIAVNAGTATRLLAWQPGLDQPYESTPVPGTVAGTPSVVALP